MKLNAGIIFDCLQAEVPIKMLGRSSDKLHLGRPRFYIDSEKAFSADQLYIVRAERLPQRPDLHKDAVIICIGDSLQISTYRSRCCVLQLNEDADCFHIANIVHDIFDRYDAWNDQLYEILNSTARIKDMLERSTSIFENPLFVIDSDFSIVASAEYENKSWQDGTGQLEADNLNFPTIAQFLEQHELSMHVKDSLLINMLDTSTLNTNLFKNDEYIGCLTIDYVIRGHHQSDIPLAKHLAGLIADAMQKLATTSRNEQSILKNALRDIIDGIPTTTEQHRILEGKNLKGSYVCTVFKLEGANEKLPMGYVCNEIENTFGGSFAFQYDSFIIGFLEVEGSGKEGIKEKDTLLSRIFDLVHAMDMRVGISDAFDNLFKARLIYMQALAALEIGSLLHPARRSFIFQDYALSEMLTNAMGELPLDMYYSNGMRRLFEHDSEAQVSYVETLRVYLENNMSISKTAADMYVHRSTLMERINRIEKELDVDLKDPDERLRMQMLFKAMRIHDQIRGISEGASVE